MQLCIGYLPSGSARVSTILGRGDQSDEEKGIRTSPLAPGWRSPHWPRPGHLFASQQEKPMYNASVYLEGNYAPVSEEITATDLEIIGELPKELNGRYLRNGANPLGEVDLASHHWFTGEGMVHGVKLQEGKALWYRNRYVRSAEIVEALGEDPAGRQFAGSANTHVIGHAGTHLRHRRGGIAAGGAQLRARHRRRQQLLRHLAGHGVHRASEDRSRIPAICTPWPTAGRVSSTMCSTCTW